MRQAGHRDERTYSEFYAPTNPGTDGQGSYFGGTCRTVVNERFRSLTVAWNPELWQSLPAEEIFELENRPDFVAIEKELLDLFLYGNNTEESERRKQLQAQKRQLISDELRRLQSDQYRDISKDSSGPDALVGHQRTMFPRIRNLMGPRDRLANGLFLTAPIRSEAGRAVLHDLIALYTQTSEVEVRPGLEPEKCCCSSEQRWKSRQVAGVPQKQEKHPPKRGRGNLCIWGAGKRRFPGWSPTLLAKRGKT
ncbi:hypothetical protein FRB93_008844 [Tulasnella sp. JGI-2019a]|nr:hypothetical protein FRB93_008844 [Tulasnella sp. JGI-2019a]